MLKTLDVLLGVILVMLLVSLLITVLTQFVVNVLNTRGRHLLHGLTDLLRQVDPALDREIAATLAAKVLTHPLISESAGRYGTVIHREELTKLLLELASGDGPQKLDEKLRVRLSKALMDNGIADPGTALAKARSLALQLELSNPELAAMARQNIALLREANSQFLAKLNSWFDQTVDRVSQRFTFTTRGITFACSVVIALLLQLDTVALVNRLWTDQALRDRIVSEAVRLGPPARQDGAAAPLVPRLSDQDRDNLRALVRNDVIALPQTAAEWRERWRSDTLPPRIPGILLTALLLSLGAPFWYHALKNLLRLRSVLAAKEDDERRGRQTTQERGPAAAADPAGPA